MNRILLWSLIAVGMVGAYIFYSSRATPSLNVTPEAQREIDKARQR